VGAAQHVFAFALALGVAILSVFTARRQFQSLQRLRDMPELPLEEMGRERRQSVRRLVSSAFLLLIALLLVVAHLWLEEPAQRLADQRDKTNLPLAESEKTFLRIYSWTWIAILLSVLAVLMLAAFDLWSIRRFGRVQHRKLRDDRRAMIARQLRRLREERNLE
jgi:cobalamin synthase